MAGCRISGFSIDFQRRLYNTLALPCQRVMMIPQGLKVSSAQNALNSQISTLNNLNLGNFHRQCPRPQYPILDRGYDASLRLYHQTPTLKLLTPDIALPNPIARIFRLHVSTRVYTRTMLNW